MGEIAETMIWAEMNGYDPNDMTPEAWEEYLEDQEPMSADEIAFEARLLLEQIRYQDEANNITSILHDLYPHLGPDQCSLISDGLKLLASQEVDL